MVGKEIVIAYMGRSPRYRTYTVSFCNWSDVSQSCILREFPWLHHLEMKLDIEEGERGPNCNTADFRIHKAQVRLQHRDRGVQLYVYNCTSCRQMPSYSAIDFYSGTHTHTHTHTRELHVLYEKVR